MRTEPPSRRPGRDEAPRVEYSTGATLADVRQDAAACTACSLYERATQTVFGEGDPHARIVLVGEQPGNDEDLAGRPFVGPAGRLLDQALVSAGLERHNFYVTNAVKHFKWKPQGKRRIHDKPNPEEIEACRPWFDRELWLIQPSAIVCLGATAARAVLGRSVTIHSVRGRPLQSRHGVLTFVTLHPSAILRMREPADRDVAMAGLVEDLKTAAHAARSPDS